MLGINTKSKARPLIHALFISAFLVLAYVGAGLTATHTKEETAAWILPTLPELAVGDWVFRGGTATESYIIQTLSKGEYSHIGIIVSLAPQPLIVHATTDDDSQRLNQVLLSSLHDFVEPTLAQHFAIAKPNFISTEQHQQAANWLVQQVGRPFVLTSRDQPHLYCTTLLTDALQQVVPDFQPQWQAVTAPLFKGEYLFPRAFAEYPNLTWIYDSKSSSSID